MSLLSVEDALSRMLSVLEPITESEELDLPRAAYRILAAPLAAKRTQPPFDTTAMDGYAVRAGDVSSAGVKLEVIGQSAAGRGFSGKVGKKQAVRIFTGAPVPPGASAILIQENVHILPDHRIEATEAVKKGQFIRPRGLDFRQDETLLQAGAPLTPAALSLAASMNHARLAVYRRPRIAILATGDELVAPGHAPGPEQIIASNGYGLAAQVARQGGEALDLGIAGDRAEDLEAAAEKALEQHCAMLVTLGGASVGDHDIVMETLEGLGMKLDFWRIAMRPGKPLMFGRLGPMVFLGLPGNPVSSLVCGQLFVAPMVARMARRPFTQSIRRATLGAALPANDLRQDYLRARIVQGDHGLVAEIFSRQDSSMLSTLASANGLVVRAPFAAPVERGGDVDVIMLEDDLHDI